MKKILLLATLAISLSVNAQSLPVVGKTLVIDWARRESTPAVYVEVHKWAEAKYFPAETHFWLLGGFNISEWSASGGCALVASKGITYAGVAALATSGRSSHLGLIGGFTGHF